MKLAIALLVVGAGVASADDRCAKGLELAKTKELARAALYLDSCTDDEGIKIRNAVAHKLEATQLSHMTIASMPDGLEGQTDAMPGDTFTTPATIWAKAGTYKITVGGQTVEKVLEPRSRTTVIINVPAPAKPPKDGVVDFEEEPEKHEGPPPAVKHGTMMPKKYLEKPSAPAGEQIEDPFGPKTGGDSVLAWRLGVRVASGVVDRGDAGVGLGVAAVAARPLDGPIMLATRLNWTHAELDTLAANVGVGYIALARPSFVLSAGLALRGEVRLQDTLAMSEVNRAGIGAAADIDLAILSLPLAFGLRGEQMFSELVPGVRNRAVLFEVGYDFR